MSEAETITSLLLMMNAASSMTVASLLSTLSKEVLEK